MRTAKTKGASPAGRFRSGWQRLLIMFLGALLLLSAGCAGKEKPSGAAAVPLEYATGFRIEQLEGGSYLVTDGEGRRLLLLPRGRQAPAQYAGLTRVETPVRRVVVNSTHEAALLRALGELGSIVGVTEKEERWHIAEIKEGMKQGRIRLVGSGMAPLDYEAVMALKPDLVFTYTGFPDTVQVVRKLEELNLPVAVENSHLETDPLGQLEWLKFMAVFYGKLDAADRYFREAVKQAQDVKATVERAGSRPRVLWGIIFEGKCYIPAGESYAANMISLAGGEYLFRDVKGTGTTTVSLEEFYARGRQADVFVLSSLPEGRVSIAGLVKQEPRLADLPAVREGRVWCFQPWYYQSFDRIVEIITDLAVMFHPELFPGAEPRHYLRLPAGDR
ncbi:MAG: ABC transporter substrate-binding protein [Clostridia bacterium]|jgi:iron complex transport system substrate-binding protein|nr:ABC transporter substrate-binding protein [Clostridia bacterium]MDH7573824.1 ABC transporter substrate-binding protein [Clostridia bacterium]